jgi:hypothetical protein
MKTLGKISVHIESIKFGSTPFARLGVSYLPHDDASTTPTMPALPCRRFDMRPGESLPFFEGEIFPGKVVTGVSFRLVDVFRAKGDAAATIEITDLGKIASVQVLTRDTIDINVQYEP